MATLLLRTITERPVNVVKTKMEKRKQIEVMITINNISTPFSNWKISVMLLVSLLSITDVLFIIQ